ncbi:MAG: NUDIX domain-containing protein [Candidatus Buchananbacteria bacterium]
MTSIEKANKINKKKLKVSLSLLIFTKDIDGQTKALIQQRGPWDYEKDQPQTYVGAWQTSVHGKLENIWEGLARETREELGDDFASQLNESEVIAMEHEEPTEDSRRVFHHLTFVPLEKIKSIKLHSSSSGFKMVTEEEVKKFRPIDIILHRDSGVPKDGIWMFDDEISSLLDGFEFIQKNIS